MMADPKTFFETLELRRLMSTSVFLGLDCLPTPASTPAPASTPTPAKRHAKKAAPIEAVIPKVTGSWTGAQVKNDNSAGAELSIDISSPAPGELNGQVDFHGPRRIRWAGQMLYNADTGHLTMYFLSSSLIARLDATLVTHGQSSSLQGTIEYFTPDGSYTATLSLLRTA